MKETQKADLVRKEGGFAQIAMLVVLLPLMSLAVVSHLSIDGKGKYLQESIKQEKAMQLAEAGIDETISRATRGLLNPTGSSVITRDFDNGRTSGFVVTYTHVMPEDVFKIHSVGRFGNASKQLMAYVGRTSTTTNNPPPPTSIDAAIALFNLNPQIQLDFKSKGYITGNDTMIKGGNGSGGPGSGAPVPGLAIVKPRLVADLLRNTQIDNPDRVTGKGGKRSFGLSEGFDLAKVVKAVRDNATITLHNTNSKGNWGSGPKKDFQVIYRQGDLQVENIQGAGIMVVTGKLQADKNFRFDGILIVLGDIQLDGSGGSGVDITGALVQGPDGKQFQLADNVEISYSTEAIQMGGGKFIANAGARPNSQPNTQQTKTYSNYDRLKGWQQVGR